MKPFGEAGIKLKNSEYYVNAPSDFARENLFYTELGGHYFLNRHYLVSRQITNFRFYVFHYVLHGEMLLVAGGKEYFLQSTFVRLLQRRHRISVYALSGESLKSHGPAPVPVRPGFLPSLYQPHPPGPFGHCVRLSGTKTLIRRNHIQPYPHPSVRPADPALYNKKGPVCN